jgi:uncharacterized protein YjbI with pentapeptide repeats
MRPICRSLSVVLLAGCFVTAVAVAGERRCEGPYKGLRLTPGELATVLRNHQAWLKSKREPTDERRANLCQADLQKARLDGANLQGAGMVVPALYRAAIFNLQNAHMAGANLQEANLTKANLQRASLLGAKFQRAHLYEADLQEADLYGANLQGASLAKANLHGVYLHSADLAGAIFEPRSLLNLQSLADAVNLEKRTFHSSPAVLIALREAFKKEGMRTQERQITYAIEHTRRLQEWNPSWFSRDRGDERSWLEWLAGKSESLFSYVLFELPSGYGMAPRRALWGLLGSILIFALPYWVALKNANHRSGIWIIVPEDRLASGRGQEKVVLIRPHTTKTWRERLADEDRLFRTSLYFSLLSAFHLGWREFNVGSWIARM